MYSPGRRLPLNASDAQVVITDIPFQTLHDHKTRTLIFDQFGNLYVQMGAFADVDEDSRYSKIRKFRNLSQLPLTFDSGELYADGVRNTVGLGYDRLERLWGVENTVNNIDRSDLHDDEATRLNNPGEELNLMDEEGAFYGYPYCFSSFKLGNYSVNTQFVDNHFMQSHTDGWCSQPQNNRRPKLVFPAHTAPLSIDFYKNSPACDLIAGAFPCSLINCAAISFHAKEISPNPEFFGYLVAIFPFNGITNDPTGEHSVVIYEANRGCQSIGGCFQPVQARFETKSGHLFVTAGDYGTYARVYRVTYGTPPPPVRRLYV